MPAKARPGRKRKTAPAEDPLARLASSLVGRLALVFLVAIAAAAGCALLLQSEIALPFAVLRWTAAALLGVASGLASRALLAGRTAALRLWAALLALLAGLVTLGLMTGGGAGAMLPQAAQPDLNWAWLVQFALGAALAWLTLHAFPVTPAAKPKARKRTTAARPRSTAAARRKSAQQETGADRADRPAAERPPALKTTRKSAPKTAASAERNAARPAAATRSASSRATRSVAPANHPDASPRPAGRVRASPASGRPSPARPRPVIHPGAPATRPDTPPAARTLWTQPAAAPTRPARSTGATQLWQGMNRRMQNWRRTLQSPQAGGRAEHGPSPAAQPVQPRRRSRSAAAPGGAQSAQIHRRASALERLRSAGGLLPDWQALAQRIRPSTPGAHAADQPVASPASPVRLLGEEEHRCPFCLELVEPGDARGMVECPICHTRHHADCWNVTGACQVPHYHG